MKQAISGVAPPQSGEVTVMTVWPTIAATGLGRALGRLYGLERGFGIITLGRVFMLLTWPLALMLFALMLGPWDARRYRLTNRRVILESGPWAKERGFVDLDRFDSIEVVVLPGQAWYRAGELVFRKGQIETFHLAGVSRPETFRQTCIKAQMSYVGVQKALQHEAAHG